MKGPNILQNTFMDLSPSFIWNPSDCNKSSPAQHLWAQELIEKLGLFDNERVIDIGWGYGRVTAAIAKKVPKGAVTGIDSSPEMIRFAREHFSKGCYPNLTFVRMDARHLTFSEEFDVVFSNAALHWITDHRPVLEGIACSLVPGGRVLIQMGGKDNAGQVFRILNGLLENPRWSRYFEDFSFSYGFFDAAEYRRWLSDAGLDPIRVELISKDMSYPAREAFGGWIRTTWLPWMSMLPENEKPVFIESLIDEYLGVNPVGDDGSIHIRMVRLEAEAKKCLH